ncbi:MAG: YbaN family protein [Ignavibacteria bacterium]
MQNKNLKKDLKIISNPAVRFVFLAAGTILVGIGVLGMFLPLLPTTIFFILAAWCFARSSEKFHFWIHNNKYFGRYLSNYMQNKGMTLRAKIYSIAFLWTGILISVLFATDALYIRILLLLIAAGVTWHLISIKTSED